MFNRANKTVCVISNVVLPTCKLGGYVVAELRGLEFRRIGVA